MKDLKHYFTDGVKGCESSKSNDDREVTKEPAVATAGYDEARSNSPTIANSRKKRERVKIKISQNNAKGKVCNIVDGNNDLIDKTPSPFADQIKKGDDHDDTPKRSTSHHRKSKKNIVAKELVEQTEIEAKRPDESDNQISMDRPEIDMHGSPVSARHVANKQQTQGEREESNAFQVLMTRKKIVQYNGTAAKSIQQEEQIAVDEHRSKLKQNKEKLIAMADKKGYSKRKLEELEEAEKIERRLEKRAKVFKQMGKKEGIDKNPGRRVSPGSLHDYFSKPNVEQKEEESMAVCTSAGRLEVMRENEEMLKVEMVARKENRGVIEEQADDIQVKTSSPSNKVLPAQLQSDVPRGKKPKWSLRINLSCSEELATDYAIARDNETMINGRRESKHRKTKAKTTNYEENENSDGDVVNVKVSKKRKHDCNMQKKKRSTITDSQNEAPLIDLEKTTSPELEIIDVEFVKQRTTEKLAPLFVKRQKPDPAILEARRLFLHSVPTSVENTKTQRKPQIIGIPVLPFPTVSHVTQIDGQSKIITDDVNIKFSIRENTTFTPSYDLRDLKSITSLKNNSSKRVDDAAETSKENLEEAIAEIEVRCSDARDIWKRVSTCADHGETSRTSPKKKGKKSKSNEKKIETPDVKIVYGRTWTQKYRPLSTREIVGNEDAAEKLRKWLEAWKAPLRTDGNDSSGDEFYSSDCSYASNFDNNQVAVLLGPHGCGKTASVYAVAEELGYSILEINASSKRAGKKILKDLEEATKSHRIKKPGATVPSLNEKKLISKNSLILVEDVDLIFDEDEGFVSATCQLASNTKRPIVMTGRDTCSHLSRMAPQQHRIYYQTTVGTRVSALLELITLAESGRRLPGPCLDRLLLGGDLRKALLQLQYLLLSGKPTASEVPTNFRKSLWQDMRHRIYKPAIRSTKKSSKNKPVDAKISSTTNSRIVVGELAKKLDGLSFLSTLIEIEDPTIEISTMKIEPSLSLDENTRPYSRTSDTSADIADWLRDRVMTGNEIHDVSQISRQLSLKKELNSGVNFALSQVSPQMLDNRVLAVDYLPAVREICRAEENRISTNNKRGNRFFHYLQSLKLPTTSTRPNILAAACKIMREKNSES